MISTATVVGFSAVFLATTAGAALVFFVSDGASEKRYTAFSGFAAGIMAAASVFSLLLPAIDGFLYFGSLKFIPATLSFLLGGAFFSVTDGIVKRLTRRRVGDDGYVRPLRTFAAMTIHNVPEGLAVGVAFGCAAQGESALYSAFALAVGIAIQNFPEGAAVSVPLKSAGISPLNAFLLGSASGLVEPMAAIVGFTFSTGMSRLLPYVMAFAAGTMIFVVVEDKSAEETAAVYSRTFMAGFALMMALDVALG